MQEVQPSASTFTTSSHINTCISVMQPAELSKESATKWSFIIELLPSKHKRDCCSAMYSHEEDPIDLSRNKTTIRKWSNRNTGTATNPSWAVVKGLLDVLGSKDCEEIRNWSWCSL